jgi:hypothetical protein
VERRGDLSSALWFPSVRSSPVVTVNDPSHQTPISSMYIGAIIEVMKRFSSMFVLLSSVMMWYFVSVSSQGTQSPTKPKSSQSMQSMSYSKKDQRENYIIKSQELST